MSEHFWGKDVIIIIILHFYIMFTCLRFKFVHSEDSKMTIKKLHPNVQLVVGHILVSPVPDEGKISH